MPEKPSQTGEEPTSSSGPAGPASPPQRPESVPTYVLDGVDRQDADTLRDLRDYIDQRIEFLERDFEEEDLVDDDEELVDVQEEGSETIVKKKQQCGKNCSGCPHGPYKYRVTRSGGSVSWEYIGKA